MKAISTKYHGPSNVRGSRFSATDDDGNRVTVSYDYALNSEENHDAAAIALCRKMGWTGTLVRGGTKTGNVYVWMRSHTTLQVVTEEWKEKVGGFQK